MGYYTHFELEIKTSSGNNLFAVESSIAEPIIADLRASNEEAEYCLQPNGEAEERGKWYDNDQNIKEFSLKYPHYVFVITGEGEESGDIWKRYTQNGKSQHCEAVITFPPFDPSLLNND